MALSLDQVHKASKKPKDNDKGRGKGRDQDWNRDKGREPLKAESATLKAKPARADSLIGKPKAAARPQIRPWSQRGLAKAGKSPKDRLGTDHHMNEEWMNLHDAPLFWIEMTNQSKISNLQDKLFAIEQRVVSLARTPCSILSKARHRLRSMLA